MEWKAWCISDVLFPCLAASTERPRLFVTGLLLVCFCSFCSLRTSVALVYTCLVLSAGFEVVMIVFILYSLYIPRRFGGGHQGPMDKEVRGQSAY